MKNYYVYILTNKPRGTLYIGVSSNLKKRIYEHKLQSFDGFTKKYNIRILVYFEEFSDAISAIEREKRLKKWNRDWKIRLIEESNKDWRDISIDWI